MSRVNQNSVNCCETVFPEDVAGMLYYVEQIEKERKFWIFIFRAQQKYRLYRLYRGVSDKSPFSPTAATVFGCVLWVRGTQSTAFGTQSTAFGTQSTALVPKVHSSFVYFGYHYLCTMGTKIEMKNLCGNGNSPEAR